MQNKNVMIVLGFILVVIISVIGFNLMTGESVDLNTTPSVSEKESMENDSMMMDKEKDDGVMMEDDKMMDKEEDDGVMMEDDKMMDKENDNGVMMEDKVENNSTGAYTNYNEDLIANAANGDVVLFFHAKWCPTCKRLDDSLNNEASAIPSNLTILKTDYDSNKSLKQKYGVTYQHTLVQVDKDGNMLNKWSGGDDLNDVLSEII